VLWCSLASIIAIICLQSVIRHNSPNSRHRNEYKNSISEVLYLVYASTLYFHIAGNYAWPSCDFCHSYCIGGAVSYISSRAITFVFLLQRAKLSQSIAPVIDPKWFQFYFPIAIFVIWGVFSFATTLVTVDIETECHSFAKIHYCHSIIGRTDAESIAAVIGIAVVEAAAAIGMLYLFVKPFLSIDESAEIPAKIKRNLKWMIWMTALNLSTTIFILIGYSLISVQFEYLWALDRALNCVTCFLMIRRNRQWLEEQTCGRYLYVGPAYPETQYMYGRLTHKLKCQHDHVLQVTQKGILQRFDTSGIYVDGFACNACKRRFEYYEFTFHCFYCNIGRYFDICAACGIAEIERQRIEAEGIISSGRSLAQVDSMRSSNRDIRCIEMADTDATSQSDEKNISDVDVDIITDVDIDHK